jgi:hypothetical protein
VISDKASNVNLDRLSIRSSRRVVEMIRHAGAESIMRKSFDKITSEKAQQEQQLEALSRNRFFRGRNESLRRRSTRRGWGNLARPNGPGQGNPRQSGITRRATRPFFPTRRQGRGSSLQEATAPRKIVPRQYRPKFLPPLAPRSGKG